MILKKKTVKRGIIRIKDKTRTFKYWLTESSMDKYTANISWFNNVEILLNDEVIKTGKLLELEEHKY